MVPNGIMLFIKFQDIWKKKFVEEVARSSQKMQFWKKKNIWQICHRWKYARISRQILNEFSFDFSYPPRDVR